MNTIQTQQIKKRESEEEEGRLLGGEKSSKQDEKQSLSSSSSTINKQQLPSSPPSATTSPSHEFSFTISLHSSSSALPPAEKTKTKTKTTTPPSVAIDLSPADDIFFHGHLLPLHLLSHLPISPRSSTNSLDSFTLPIKELLDDDDKKPTTTSFTTTATTSNNNNSINTHSSNTRENNKGRTRPKSFSFFGFSRKRKGNENGEKDREIEKEEEEEKKKKKMSFNMSQILKRYAKMVRPLLFYKGGKSRENGNLHRQPYSFSGSLSLKRNKHDQSRGRRGEFSAPASMWTSPTNSGLLLTTPTAMHSSTSESSMEELQSAIQAAIAHCKNSISMKEDKLKC